MPHHVVSLSSYRWDELWHPGVLTLVVLLQIFYLFLLGPARARFNWGPPVPLSTKVYGTIAIWLIYASEGTPLHVLAENFLFSAHMVQHVVLTMITAPFLLLGTPDWFLRPLLKRRWTAGTLRLLTRPVVALLAFNLIYAIWHLPGAYESVLYYHWFHMVQHGLLFFTALMTWWPICSPLPELPRLSEPGQMFYMFISGVTQIAVYSMLTYADNPVYKFYESAPRIWGIDALVDQQTAGMIMNLGGMTVLVIVWGIVFFRWANREERAAAGQA